MGCCNDNNWKETCDPFKRICYQYGMLLGVDEFQQEQSYHRSKHRMQQRLFIGYGMVYGGDFSVVKVPKTETTPEHLALRVHRLFGLDDLGRELWLKDPCEINLSKWWTENKNAAALQAQEEDVCSAPQAQTVYVTIGYKQCCTTPVPAVAPPCDDQTAPTMSSRIFETVECQISRSAPKDPPTDLQVARPADVRWSEQAVKNLASWVESLCKDDPRPLLLGTLEITEGANGSLQVKKARNHALPRIAMKGMPAFQVVSVHPNLYCREPTLDVRFTLPPLVAPIEAFHVLELRPPSRRPKAPPKHAPHAHGPHGHGPHGHGPHAHGQHGMHAQYQQAACAVDGAEEEEEVVTRCLSGLRELVDPNGVVLPDECDPTLLRIPLCDTPTPGNPYRVIISGMGTSAVLTKDLVALNDGADFTIAFQNKEKSDTAGV